jgi:protein-tyrosine phosphatase
MLLPSSSSWRLQRDIATLRYWGAQALVTLLEKPEFALMRLGDLPTLAASHQLAWYHIPLRDGHVPDDRFEVIWQSVAPRLRRVLWCGGRVALHCGDGRSRTAMVTAKLLVELGCPAQDALNRVRGARPGVLSRPEEEQFVRAQTPAAEAVHRAQLSVVHPLGLRSAAYRGEESELEGESLPVDNPNQLDLLRSS